MPPREAVLLHPVQDVSHPFVQSLHTVYAQLSSSLGYQMERRVSRCLGSSHPDFT